MLEGDMNPEIKGKGAVIYLEFKALVTEKHKFCTHEEGKIY